MNSKLYDLQQSIIDISTDDYGLVIHNINDAGMGLRIKAGDPTYPKSLAILSGWTSWTAKPQKLC
jgi:hypothetical protein